MIPLKVLQEKGDEKIKIFRNAPFLTENLVKSNKKRNRKNTNPKRIFLSEMKCAIIFT